MKRRFVKGSAWALVTGTSRGIGLCYAERLAELGYNLVIVANNGENLERVKKNIEQKYSVKVHTEAIDLARVEAASELYNRVCRAGIEIDILINNAGMFSFCDILATPDTRVEQIIMLHNITTTKLCQLYAHQMISRGIKGYILNMSSYSLWMPFPGLALYSASKAYLKSFSVAFAKEVRSKNIYVTAVCPAGVATNLYGLAPRWQKIGSRVGALISADYCAKRGLSALQRGRLCIVPDWWNRIWIPLCNLLPICVINPIRKFTMKYQK